MAWFRSTEASVDQLVATGAVGGYGVDPIDNDFGYRPIGATTNEVPPWTLAKSRAYSIAAYRSNPMARAILDTYTSFCVGDSGLTLQCGNPDVRAVAERFWKDPKNQMGAQELMLRSHLILGESVYEMMVGQVTGVTRRSPIDPQRIIDIELAAGNPLWPSVVVLRNPGADDIRRQIVSIDDVTERRTGDVMFWATWKALETDRRGQPFLSPILDDLDNYDTVLSNLIDRTALARYLVWDVEVKGGQSVVDQFVADRGGLHVPRSGSVEVHNEGVKWEPKTAQVGAQEDTMTAKALLTNVAGGAGLAKTWLAEPEDANRATSLTMAEPVRRRVGGVQNTWLGYMTDMVRFAVDQAVTAGRLPAMVPSTDRVGTNEPQDVAAADTVTITGPEIAAADAQITATILESLSKSLAGMVAGKILSPEAARIAVKQGWEQFVGRPWTSDLDITGASADDLADELDKAPPAAVTLKLA